MFLEQSEADDAVHSPNPSHAAKSSIQPSYTSGSDFADFKSFPATTSSESDDISQSEESCSNNIVDQRPETIRLHNDLSSATQSAILDTNTGSQQLSNGELSDSGVYSSNVSPIQHSGYCEPQSKQGSGTNAMIGCNDTDKCDISDTKSEENFDDGHNNVNVGVKDKDQSDELTSEHRESRLDHDTQDLEKDMEIKQCKQVFDSNENSDKDTLNNGIPSSDIPVDSDKETCKGVNEAVLQAKVPSVPELNNEMEIEKTKDSVSESKSGPDICNELDGSKNDLELQNVAKSNEENDFEYSEQTVTANTQDKSGNDVSNLQSCEDDHECADIANDHTSSDTELAEPELSVISANEDNNVEVDVHGFSKALKTDFKEENMTELTEAEKNTSRTECESEDFENVESVDESVGPNVNEESNVGFVEDFGDFSETNFDEIDNDFEDFNSSFNASAQKENEADSWSAFPETNNDPTEVKACDGSESEWAAFSSPGITEGDSIGVSDSKEGWSTFPEAEVNVSVKEEDDTEDWGNFDDESTNVETVTSAPTPVTIDSVKLSAVQLQTMVSVKSFFYGEH